jgi:hypothetical protein
MEALAWARILLGGAALSAGLAAGLANGALADSDAEKAKLAQCAKDLCAILVTKNASGPDLACDLTKTWEKDEIQKGADSKNISWGLGSARCSAKIAIKRADIVAAVSQPVNTFKLSKQSIACEIGTEKYQISAAMAPQLKFKDGATTEVALNVSDIQGATLIKGIVWTAATLEKTFGILQGDMVREVNRFIKRECPRIHDSK